MKPLILLGAPRSGTNVLRDTLCSSNKFITWDCDEINYIWRVGLARSISDEFNKNDVNNFNKSYIRNCFRKVTSRKIILKHNPYIVEKTCANCLRLDFVNNILPEAKYIYIKRNPFDSISSIRDRWLGETSSKYLLKKAKFIPKNDLIYYSLRYLKHRIYQKFSTTKELPSWGPRFNGIDKFRQQNSLIETCAMQWYQCTTKVENNINLLLENNKKVFTIEYEKFTTAPEQVLREMINYFDMDFLPDQFNIESINSESIGKGLKNLSNLEIDLISSILNK